MPKTLREFVTILYGRRKPKEVADVHDRAPGINPSGLIPSQPTTTTTTTTLPSETLALAQTPTERELLLHFAKVHGVAWIAKRANLVLQEARALGEV